ncbi:MAG: GNAT family N-acetyltransferase [Rubrivivax sp.]|nr:GNAT family N-acetyltransferase [Rubrivivax sp.]
MNDDTMTLPRSLQLGGATLQLARLQPQDAPALAAFAAALPPHDLLFLRRDISHPKVVAAWMQASAEGRLHSLTVREGDALVGCSAIVVDELSWSRHVGELRVLVAPAWRGRGLGRVLIQQCFAQALALGLDKLVAQMTVDQVAAIAVFEELGFRAEALLRDHVKDRDGQLHDLALLSHDVAAVQSRLQAFGVADALR